MKGAPVSTYRGGRPAGRRNARPSAAAIAGYYRLLGDAASSGDTLAAGALVINDTMQRNAEQSRIDTLRTEVARNPAKDAKTHAGFMGAMNTHFDYLRALAKRIDNDNAEQGDPAERQEGHEQGDPASATTTSPASSTAGRFQCYGASDSRPDLAEQLTQADKESTHV